ncbi:MAG TPA: hypothetical protein VKT27_06140 [Candidatus Binataceae bacterium]|nr:hypothetical protein [Candidatus Binataceae bacterium]
MKVLLLQLDGKLPNLALMRLAAHHRGRGDLVELRRAGNFQAIEPRFGDQFDRIYASLIFSRSEGLMDRTAEVWMPRCEIFFGGTGVSPSINLEVHGIGAALDYSDYPDFRQSIGFTQRGCRLRCSFCVVPEKEGKIREEQRIADIWRGDPWPRELLLLDNDFFGQPHWRERIEEIRAGRFKVSFNQGINARALTDEAAEAIASVDYRADNMKERRIYTAWDNLKDENRMWDGLNRLTKYGVRPSQIMIYMLIGYWPGETHEDREHRRRRLRVFGAIPYPMPYARTPELVGYQRWVIGAYDKIVPWVAWRAAGYRPEKLGLRQDGLFASEASA